MDSRRPSVVCRSLDSHTRLARDKRYSAAVFLHIHFRSGYIQLNLKDTSECMDKSRSAIYAEWDGI